VRANACENKAPVAGYIEVDVDRVIHLDCDGFDTPSAIQQKDPRLILAWEMELPFTFR